jgi:hypothetical protein
MRGKQVTQDRLHIARQSIAARELGSHHGLGVVYAGGMDSIV